MSAEIALLMVVGIFFLLLAFGTEIAIAMLVASIIGFLFVIDQPLIQIAWTAFDQMNSFTYIAVPLFIFMGTMFANTGVIRSLFDSAEKLIGGLPGGLASATIGGEALFGAMSGSCVAAVATFGVIALPEMERKGYHHRISIGSIVVGGTLAVLIPPSVLLIIYGGWQNVSVVRLFAAAIIPGIILAFLLLITVIIMVKLNPSLTPKPPKYTWRERLLAIRSLAPWLGIIGLVLGTIFTGIMTPTESAALGAFLGIAVAAGYRKLTFTAFKESALATVRITSMIAFVICTAILLSFVFHASGLTDTVKVIFMQLPIGKYGALLLIYLMYFVLGMIIDDLAFTNWESGSADPAAVPTGGP